MAWVAIDRAVKDVERFKLDGPVVHWRRLRDTIHAQICEHGFDAEIGSFVQSYGSKDLDASLLMMPLVGFLPLSDPRMRGTVEAIERHLVTDGFVARYAPSTAVDGLPPGEAAFLLCTFWLADNLALLGRRGDARRLFERLLNIRNDVGLLAEQYDPAARRFIGNFPQAFSHVALINTAHNLTQTGGPAATGGGMRGGSRARARGRARLEEYDVGCAAHAFFHEHNAEHVLLEIVDEAGRDVAPGNIGRVLVTTLENYLMPLVRYEIGDYAVATQGRCSCGRTLPLLGRILGRQVNLFRKSDGSLISGWQVVGTLRKFPDLKTFQVVQKSILQFCVRYVAGRPLSPEGETAVRSKLRDDLGEAAEVAFEQVTEIQRAPSGKFMVTVCQVPERGLEAAEGIAKTDLSRCRVHV